jgi:hypothetical protein
MRRKFCRALNEGFQLRGTGVESWTEAMLFEGIDTLVVTPYRPDVDFRVCDTRMQREVRQLRSQGTAG